MSTATVRILIAGTAALAAFGTGIFLSSLGRPLNTAVFTVHKLLAVAGIVFLLLAVAILRQSVPSSSQPIVALIISGVLLLVLLITGSLLSFERFTETALTPIHKFTAFATMAFMVLVAFIHWRSLP